MFDHVTIRVSDRDASMRFYRLALGDPEHDGDFAEWGEFSLLEDTTVTRNLHVAFGVPRRDAVDAWWRKLVDAGYQGDGEPGPRPQYSDSYYGGFVRDPDGNSIEAVHHETTRGEGIDHLWLRSRDVAAAKAFYETAAPIAGIRLAHARDDFAHFRFSDGTGSFSFVADGAPATENVHLAFGANDTAGRRALPPHPDVGGLPRQRRARRAPAVPHGLPRRVRARPRRAQRRSRLPRPAALDFGP